MATKKAERSSRSRQKGRHGEGGEEGNPENERPPVDRLPPVGQRDDRDIGQYSGEGTPPLQKK